MAHWLAELVAQCSPESVAHLPAESVAHFDRNTHVIERSLIVSSGDIFSVDEAWLSKESSQPPSQVQVLRPLEGESRGEREIIEAALAESRGRIAGPSGAAAKLQIPPSTLEYKIKTLKISKNQFKFR